MVGPLYDCVGNPLGAVRVTFNKSVTNNPSTIDGKEWGAVEVFRHHLFDQSSLNQVPIINARNVCRIPPKSLVRFRGVIHDMHCKEFYLGAYKDGDVWRTNKYTDETQNIELIDANSHDKRLWERTILHCVPIPGINEWADVSSEESIERYLASMSLQRDKRARAEMGTICKELSNDPSDIPSSKKMKEESCHLSKPSSSASLTPELGSYSFPVDPDPFSCIVKVYDSPDGDLKLNEIFEFIGVLEFCSDSPPENSSSEEDEDMDPISTYYRLPRIHCIIHRKLSLKDLVPCSPNPEPNVTLIRNIRNSLLNHLSNVLGNDELTANFMLLHLLSKTNIHRDNMPIGKLCLNITCFNGECASVFGKRLGATLKSLLPISQTIPLTVEFLNTQSVAPRKDYDAERMIPGSLNLTDGSHLTFDETALKSGILNSTGGANTQSLMDIVLTQTVEYDFVYYKLRLPLQVQVLVLSESKSRHLPADVVVPFLPRGVAAEVAVEETTLNTWRWYLANMRSVNYEIESDVEKVVQDDFVAARQADPTFRVDDLSTWLNFGRLVAASFGEKKLSLEHWQFVRELERLRKQRVVA